MSQHASPSPSPQGAPEPAHAERVRTLLAGERLGTLATQSQKHAGWPFASVMPYALAEGSPFFFISSMAVHTQNVLADSRASLLVMQSGGDADPLGAPRATLLGNVTRIEATDALRAAYLERHPSARYWIDFSDFSFFRLDVTDVYFVGGFGVMGWVSAPDYQSAAPDPLMDAAAGILAHMNADHADALRAIARHFAGMEAEEATMVAVDRLGFTIRARTAEGMKGARIAFPEEVRTRDDARRVLVAMTRAARG
jgi:putative heme iron utilization protein